MRVPSAYRSLSIRTKLGFAFVVILAPYAVLPWLYQGPPPTALSLAAVAALLACAFTLRAVTRPVFQLQDFLRRHREGDRDALLKVDTRDELGEIAANVSDMLAAARRNSEEVERQNWLRSEVARITGLCHGVRELSGLAQAVIKELAPAVGAGAGIFYVRDSQSAEQGRLELAILGTYAFDERKRFPDRIRPGEGLVGQCALERKPILLTRVPPDYMRIESGLGDEAPLNILVVPVQHEERVMGVIELASFHEFFAPQRELVNELAATLGVLIDGLESRARTERLLVESRRLSEEAQAQAEQLEIANSELIEKKSVAEKMAEQLQQQAEELQAANEELEEKSEALERQRLKLEEKNAELERARERVEQKARELELASRYKSEFLANMSHELRTPLNSLLILAQSLADNADGNLNEDQVESANIICSGGRQLLALINDILDLSKVEAGKLDVNVAAVPVRELVRSLEREFAAVARQRALELRVEIGEVPATLQTDRQRVEQILRNLLANAFKFTHAGSVTLRAARPNGIEPRSPGLHADEAIAFSVIDTGIGIPPDKQEAIFEAFRQADGSTSRRYGGTGLGLTISRELARLLGGEIHLRSKENEGSTFTLLLPAPAIGAEESGAATGSAPSPGPAAGAGNGNGTPAPAIDEAAAPLPARGFVADDRATLRPGDRSILIVEDDATFAGIVMKIARRKGFKCLASDTARQGLALAFHYRPSGIVLDVTLPDRDGLDVLEALKNDPRTRHIPVHVVSGHDRGEVSLERGAVSFLKKPTTAEALHQVFAQVEQTARRPIKRLLVVDDDVFTQRALATLLARADIQIANAASGAEARQRLRGEQFDCAIVDLSLGDMSGFELLDALRSEDGVDLPPTIIYTGRELSLEENNRLLEYARTIVVKGEHSPERLLDEVSLFLHSVESQLPDARRRAAPALVDQDGSLRNRRVLLVDDDMRNSFALAKALRQHGLDVRQADNGQRALELLEAEGDISIVLMDLMMPVMDGYEAMRRIREHTRWRGLPILALTARAMPEDRMKCVEAGANDYLCKPVDIDKLLSMMRVWLFNADESQRC